MKRASALAVWPLALTAAIALVFVAQPAHAETLELTAAKDNTIFESSTGALSNGAGPRAFMGTNANGNTRRYLVEFDVAGAVPPGSTITNVTLGISIIGIAPGNTSTLRQDVHRLFTEWGEGTSNSGSPGGMGAPSQTGDATWTHAFKPTMFWLAGGDYVLTPSGEFVESGFGRWEFSSVGMAADVQMWLDDATTNNGWILKDKNEANSTAVAFPSREDPFPNSVPTLIIEFDPPGDVPFCDPANNNSTGFPAVLSGALTGSPGTGLHLECSGGPSGNFGYFLIGSGMNNPGIVVGSGRLCLSVTSPDVIGRYNVDGTVLNSIGQFDAAGNLQNVVGTSSVGSGYDVPFQINAPGGPIMSGETWHFQVWYRDGAGISNFSNGVSATF